jgi:hypothetical protein
MISAANAGVASDNSAAVKISFLPMISPPMTSALPDRGDRVKSSCPIKGALGPTGGATWTDGRCAYRENPAITATGAGFA